MRLLGHMGVMEMTNTYKIHINPWLESLNRKDHPKDLGIDEKIISKWNLDE
jgi:hypothetical protein